MTVFESIKQERQDQDAAFGTNNYPPAVWLTILAEEFGEVASEAEFLTFNEDGDTTQLRRELVQVAAVAVAWIERLDEKAEDANNDSDY